MHTQGDFFANLLQRHPHLSQAELRLAALLRIDKTSKDIAFLTNTTPDSVNTARSRLRKKLDLPKEQDLVAYLKGIGSGAHNLGPEHSNWELDSAAINLPQLSPPE